MSGRPKEFDPKEALGAATAVFWKCGYEATSMADLVEQMKINRQSVYDTYGDKRALFMEALKQYADRVGMEIGQVLLTGPSPAGRVRNFLKRISERVRDTEGRGCLLTNTIVEMGPTDPEIRTFVSALFQRLEDVLTENLKQAVAQGELKSTTDPRGLARVIMTLMQGALVLSKTNLKTAVADAMKTAEALLLPA